MSQTVLERILESTRQELARRKALLPLEELRARASERELSPPASGRRLLAALLEPGIGVIAEFKRRSPSAGSLSSEPDITATIGAYERGGACAVSVLTEGPHFEGALEDLHAARAACTLPILRKDFILEEYQLLEALIAGADAVLLIVAALDPEQLASLLEKACALGLDALVEVHDRDELEVALGVGADLLGVNNRDLRDFTVDLRRTARLMPAIPEGVNVVSESGISSNDQLQELQALGVSAVLVGETLMRSPDPARALLSLRERPHMATQ